MVNVPHVLVIDDGTLPEALIEKLVAEVGVNALVRRMAPPTAELNLEEVLDGTPPDKVAAVVIVDPERDVALGKLFPGRVWVVAQAIGGDGRKMLCELGAARRTLN